MSKKKVKKSSDRKADRSSSKPNTKQTTQPQTTDESKDTMELTRYQRWRARAVDLINERLQNESKKMIALKFFAAPIVVLLGILFLYLFLEFGIFSQIGGLMVAYFFPPLGKESVIPIGVAAGLHPVLIALSIAFVDIFIALFLLWNYDFAKLIPSLGPWMENIEKTGGNKFKEKPWLEHLAFIGLILFVMFPFQGSGGVVTSIIGRVIGMNKYKVFAAICIGAVVGCILIAYFADYIIGFFGNDLYQALIFLIIIAIALGLYNGFKHFKK